MRRLFPILLCATTMLGTRTLSAARSTNPKDDPVTTCVLVPVEGSTTRVVMLRPLRRARYLKKQIPEVPAMNARVVRMLLEYPRDGTHDYWWPRKGPSPYDGSTTDIVLHEKTVMRGEAKGRTFCCGLTLEVCYRALLENTTLPPDLTSATASSFMRLWFCTGKNSPGPVDAMEKFGIGQRIAHSEDALPGDFVQIWRADGTGHSVVFVAWARDRRGRRVGMHYWSTQASTDGIGFNAEPIGKFGKVIDLDRTSFARLRPPWRWDKPLQLAD